MENSVRARTFKERLSTCVNRIGINAIKFAQVIDMPGEVFEIR